MRCEVLVAVKMSMLVLYVVTPCELAGEDVKTACISEMRYYTADQTDRTEACF
jgi:hypothetical protein